MKDEKIHRQLIANSVFSTGNPWIDDCLAGGLNQENLMLVAAKTGVGKTFYGVQLATHAARLNKNVYYFALEAEKYEIERRRLYYETSRLVHKHYPQLSMPRYREWLHQSLNDEWESIEKEAAKTIEQENDYLKVKYSHGIYTPQNFKHDVLMLLQEEQKPDLIILDHLHHLFLSGDEIEALKSTIHGIKSLKSTADIPVVVLAQLRKNDAGTGKRTMPKLEDIRGTASLTDVATDVLLISPVGDDAKKSLPSDIKHPMYFHLAKSRTASECRDYVGVVGYSASEGCYSKSYSIAKSKIFEDPELIDTANKPPWAKNAIVAKLVPEFFSNKKPYGGSYE